MAEQKSPGASGIPDAAMGETPPVAVTPGDDGSDFYNTPYNAGTPAKDTGIKDGVANASTTEEQASSSQPAPLIPGLNLVNDNYQDAQSGNNQTMSETTDANVEGQHTAQNEQNATITMEPTPPTEEAMEVDQKDVQNQQAGNANGEPVAIAEVNPDTGVMDTTRANEVVQNDEDQEGEHPEWEVDSSPYESSSDDSTTDSSDDSDDDEDYPILSAEEQARILMQAELGSDDEGEGKGKTGGHIKTANEVAEEAPPIPDITITHDMKIVFLGHVQTIVENTAVIEANVSGEYQVLEAGSLLCSEDRKIIGVVCETLGRVENPLYTIRYANAAAAEERGITQGKHIYYVEAHSSFVFTQPLKGLKGSDASNFHDEEIGEDEIEFSDDEAEAEYKRRIKQKRQEKKEARDGPSKARRGPPGPSKLKQTELNYDDDAGDDGYTPLARPKDLHKIMAQQEAPVEGDGPARGTGFRGGRGRGRGSDRGRGGGHGRGGPRDQGFSHRGHRSSSSADPQSQSQQPQPSNNQAAYQPNQQTPMPQQYAQFTFPQQMPPQQPYAQGSPAPTPYPFQMPYMQAFQQQPNLYQQMGQMPQMPHINPLFLAALQQSQHQTQQQQQPQVQPQTQQAMNFDQVNAQLDLLRQLSNNNQGNQGPRPS